MHMRNQVTTNMRILREFPALFNKTPLLLSCKVGVSLTGEVWSFEIASRMRIKELIACPDNPKQL